MLPTYVALPRSACVPTTANVKLIPNSLPVWQPLTEIDVDPPLWKNKRQPVSSLVGHFAAEQVFASGVTPREVTVPMETFFVTGGFYFAPPDCQVPYV